MKDTKELSVGVIITDGAKILGCLPWRREDAKNSYDLPKGHWEEGETLVETACRECKEESGFDIWAPEALIDLGRFNYIPTKDLHLFMYAVDYLPPQEDLSCTPFFDSKGKRVPEIIGYRHIAIEELDYFFPSMRRTIAEALDVFYSDVEPSMLEVEAPLESVEEDTLPVRVDDGNIFHTEIICQECGSDNYMRERRRDGITTCMDCGATIV
jgi:8-oxo-dGTP pyrophosphatase MutT (NUDIX family)